MTEIRLKSAFDLEVEKFLNSNLGLELLKSIER
jgi:hypothetical protein